MSYQAQSSTYEPSRSITARLSRRLTPYLARRSQPVRLKRPLICFTFDDCPQSAITYGVKPLEALGYQATLYIASDLLGTTNHHGSQITSEDVRPLHESGHEIGDHSFSHLDAQSVTPDEFLADIDHNQDQLAALGLPPSETFAYPFGQTNPKIKKALETRFLALRGISPQAHRHKVDLNQIGSFPVFSGRAFERALKAIKDARTQPAFLTFFTHDIQDNPTPWGCRPQDMARLIQAAQDSQAEIVTVADATQRLLDHQQSY